MAVVPPTLEDLENQRIRLLRSITSGILEVEQPVLGRTQYRSMDEMDRALRYLDQLIWAAGGGSGASADPAAQMRRRRPIYPVVREV